MNTLVKISLILILAALIPVVSASEFHGYFRSGVMSPYQGVEASCFKIPGGTFKYRLGNECETYAELNFKQTVGSQKQNNLFHIYAGTAFVVPAHQDWETFSPSLRQMYAYREHDQAGFLKGATLWAGKRFYRRHDLHINDFYYWDNSGPGGGIESLSLGIAKVSFAYRQNRAEDQYTINGYDFRIHEIENFLGEFTFGVDYRSLNNPFSYDGVLFNFIFRHDRYVAGYNKLILQYGRGMSANMNAIPDVQLSEVANTWRIIDQWLYEGNRVSVLWAVVYEKRHDNQQWFSTGLRTLFYLDDHFNLALEAGVDELKPWQEENRRLGKVTVAPQYAFGKGFWSRPVLRVFVTYATWNGVSQTVAEPGSYIAQHRKGLNAGLQAEAWW